MGKKKGRRGKREGWKKGQLEGEKRKEGRGREINKLPLLL